jgi:transposase
MRVIIYGLVDPISNKLFYIGKTKNLDKRNKWNKFVMKKISSFHYIGLDVKKTILEELLCTCNNDWVIAERKWIKYYKQKGFKLYNQNKGGGGPSKHSRKTRRLLSEISSQQTRCHSLETRRKIGLKSKGHKVSKRARRIIGKKVSMALIGIKKGPFSKKHKKALSKAHLGIKYGDRKSKCLTRKKAEKIRELSTKGIMHKKIAERFNISRPTVTDVVYFRSWK